MLYEGSVFPVQKQNTDFGRSGGNEESEHLYDAAGTGPNQTGRDQL